MQGYFYAEKDLGSIYSLLYGVAGCSLWRCSKRTEVYGETIGIQRFVGYIAGVCCRGEFVKRGSTVQVLTDWCQDYLLALKGGLPRTKSNFFSL